ncbi:hypothetical protein DWF00_14625 [Bosea caraganae]|uniref:Uncharacterized protein n=1 Tax=Bosea caraganae TaxID=2763117 RepID=A0A370KYL2_9HYPH|nr:hypothetical protein DWE98_26510 [Bosea caraganae]RDJ25643.1 hypothetical protein DWF00_14625 [Bosea caraganae]
MGFERAAGISEQLIPTPSDLPDHPRAKTEITCMTVTNWAREVLDLDIALMRIELWVVELRRGLALSRSANSPSLKYNPNQPRVPEGRPNGGQWTDGGSGEGGGGGTLSDWSSTWLGGAPGVGFDRDIAEGLAAPSDELGEWGGEADESDELPVHEASNRSRSSGGSWPNASPAQQARLTASELQAQAAIRRVQEIDARWRPGSSISEGIEGSIATNQAIVRQAEGRLRELQGMGLGFGPFARDSIPARGPGRTNAEEQRDVNRMGYIFGCHTCGATTPGTQSGNYIGDHQRPNALSPPGQQQWLVPHCLSCSRSQGGAITGLKWRR